MAFTEYTKDTTIIGALGTNPAERGLTTQEFKDKFDQFAEEFVEWFNATHIVEANAHLAETATLVDLGHVQHGVYTAIILTTWTGSVAPFSQEITVTGIKATDIPIVDIVPTGTYATDNLMEDDWGKIYRIVTSADTITVYAHEKTVASIPIQLKVVR